SVHPQLPSFPTRRSSDLDTAARSPDSDRSPASRSVEPALAGGDRLAEDRIPLGQCDVQPGGRGAPTLRSRLVHGSAVPQPGATRSEEHTSELQSLAYLVC